jgi:hypothetical protein
MILLGGMKSKASFTELHDNIVPRKGNLRRDFYLKQTAPARHERCEWFAEVASNRGLWKWGEGYFLRAAANEHYSFHLGSCNGQKMHLARAGHA